MASVAIRDVRKAFGAIEVIHGVDVLIDDGEFVVLVGPSGCGKSTLLRMIAGLENITSGEIRIGERVVNRVPPKERDIAMVFQNYALYPHMTVAANMGFSLRLRGADKAEIDSRVRRAAEILGLMPLLERRPAQLSGGQRQRVALGRAIVRNPQVFLFDEPLSNLDAKLRSELRAELRQLHRALGATMIYVTHDQAEAMTMGQRIAVLHEGRLRQLGTPAEMYGRPADTFVARFIGSPGMNVLHGQGRGMGEGGGVVDCGGLSVPVALEHYEGEILLGVRPEHVSLCAVEQGAGDAAVRVVEPLGAETLVHLDVGGQTLVAKLPGMVELHVGDRVGVNLDRRRLHLFDGAGERLE